MSDLPPPPSPPTGWPGHTATSSGFWRRFVASLIIDGIIVTVFFVPAQIALTAGPRDERSCLESRAGDATTCEVPSREAWALWGLFAALGLTATLVYYARTQGRNGQSLGYMALGIKLVDIDTGQPVGAGRAIGRYFAKILSTIPCYLGFFWMLWDPQKQTWHDKMTASVVIRT